MMKIITNSRVQILGNSKVLGMNSSADGLPAWYTPIKRTPDATATSGKKAPMGPPAPTKSELPAGTETPKKKIDFEKAKNVYTQAKEAGLIDQLRNKVLGGPGQEGWGPSTAAPDEEKKGMSTSTKVIIGVVAAGVVAAIIYYAASGSSSTKKATN